VLAVFVDIVAWLTTTPAAATTLATLLRAALAWQTQLTYPEYRLLHAAKRATFPTLQRVTPSGLSFVNAKGYHDDAEYLATTDGSVRGVARRLQAGGGSLHLINSIKRRPTPAGEQYSAAHVVWTHDDGQQTEAYLFSAVETPGVDVYAHTEASVTDPDAHLDGPQPDGDPRGVVRAALADAETSSLLSGGEHVGTKRSRAPEATDR